MARRKKKGGGGGDPAWLITFSDLMTLLLTFFVLLLSMAVIDERAKLVVLGSVSRTFGSGSTVLNPLGDEGVQNLREPGAMQDGDLAAMRDMLFEDVDKDLNFQENKYVQILSINDRVLFVPGSTELSEEGVELLDKILPYLQNMQYPLLVAGHTSLRRDEESTDYSVDFDKSTTDATWPLSHRRALSVYRHLVLRGIPPEHLSLEAFGQFHPRFTNNTPAGRRRNRRVDLVLDKRNREWIQKVEALRQTEPDKSEVYFKGFRFDFDLEMPGATRSGGAR